MQTEKLFSWEVDKGIEWKREVVRYLKTNGSSHFLLPVQPPVRSFVPFKLVSTQKKLQGQGNRSISIFYALPLQNLFQKPQKIDSKANHKYSEQQKDPNWKFSFFKTIFYTKFMQFTI